MGYYTVYTLRWEPQDSAVEEFIRTKQAGDENFAYGVTPYGEMTDSVKWYEYDIDMKTLSKAFPEIIFTLSGEGEESGDVWKNYYKNGKKQADPGIITFAGFDPKKLK